MHIRIEAESRRGLRIIGEIPNISLCRIEGYNGIGKTNAIKLLRLCTGDQPFVENDHSWRTFRNQLKSARVAITGLHGAQEITWTIDPSLWPETAEPLGDLIGGIRIDGQPARPRDVSPLLSVHHVMAADTPVSVLTERINTAQKHIQGWDSEVGRQRQEEIELLLGELQNKITECTPSQLSRDLSITTEAEKLAKSLADQLKTARERIKLLDRAVEVSAQLTQVRGRGPEMDQKIQELARRLENLDEQRRELDNQIKNASAQKHNNEKAEKEFENAQRHLVRQDKAFRTMRSHLQHLAAAAGVDPSEDALAAAKREASQHLNSLLEQQPRINATPILVNLLNSLTSSLESAEEEGLGNTVLIDSGEKGSGWTVAALKEAFQHQAQVLSEMAPSADAEQLAEEIEATRGRLGTIAQTETALRDLETGQTALAKAEGRLLKATKSLPEQTARNLEDLMLNRTALDQETRTVQGDHARLSHTRELLGGGKTEDALAAELVQLCRKANVEVARLRGLREKEQAELEELTRREAQASQQAALARRTSQGRLSKVTSTAHFLSQDSEISWLRQAVPQIGRLPDLSPADQAEVLTDVAAVIDRARDSLASTYSSLRGMETALGRLGSRIRQPNGRTGTETDSDRAAKLWLADEVRQWFESEVVRAALFNGGRDVRLDPDSLQLSWTAEDGQTNERPLAAFSSGQQAFAYTQAQVARLDRDENAASNRLIALDEFGSFIDAKNMSALASYLQARQVQAPNDQVLVILPLEISPAMASSNGSTNERVNALRERGYFAEAFQL
ncbi:hypothetical protein F7R91_40520 [Streptomyces luteolifulvus]|uniref:Uncharacterized protein n=1 Tax=Streptomyces luteolifulvus TaxID=2615112 RepID=A0A643JPQ4_9ACTN|nr:hypothetical protein [Streptomyces luteolifulvus]KAB1139319.1 hypothetical protein F7R91_40520 [Streptomyces luteolifulvus]